MEDLTTKVLIEIRDEIRVTRSELSARIDQTNERLDQTNERLDQTNERLDQTNERLDQTNQRLDLANGRLDRLERRQSEAEIRIGTEIVGLVGAIRDLRDTILEDRQLRQTVANHETRLRALESQPR